MLILDQFNRLALLKIQIEQEIQQQFSLLKKNYKIIEIDLSKQQTLDADPRSIQQISFTANLDRTGNTTIVFIIEGAKETILGFLLKNCKSLVNVL